MTQATEIAAGILKRAVELDTKKRYTESRTCYVEGIQILMGEMKHIPTIEEQNKLRTKIAEFMSRAEKLQEFIETEKELGSYHEQIVVEENSCGYSYERVFGRFFDQNISKIEVDDPYIRLFHQCQNFLRLCELAVKKCVKLNEIILTTIHNNAEQEKWLQMIRDDLVSHFKVKLIIHFSSTLHDREIRLDNGWIIKPGRGLDYFKRTDSNFSIGTNDMDLRKCHETTIDIFYKKNVRKTNG